MPRSRKPASEHTAEPQEPGRSLYLPLMGLTDKKFEEFCTDLVNALPQFTNARRHGGPGDTQSGIDAAADRAGKHVGLQYRRVQRFGPAAFTKTIAAAAYAADEYILTLGSKAKTPLRNAVRNAPGWELWDAEDLARHLSTLSETVARTLLDTYFNSGVRTRFLGRVGPATFHDVRGHFQAMMQEGLLFDHRLALVGREDVLTAFKSYLNDANLSVAVLPGRGGIGKSRILKAFGEAVEGAGWTVLFAAENAPFDDAALDELPPEPCLVVVDDGHRRPDLGQLMAHLTRRKHATKLVVAIRPEGRPVLVARLRESGVDVRSVRWLEELQQLTPEQGEALARAALGDELAHLARPVYQITRDCTLVTVVAARLLKEHQVSPALLTEYSEFRDGVLARFRDASLGRVSDRVHVDLARRVLELVSALQPFNTDVKELRETAGKFLGVPASDVVRALDELEKAGVLLRRGYSVRVVPDVLGDYILGSACLTSTGQPTGYGDELLEHFSSVAFDRLLANLSEVDWRVRSAGNATPDLLATQWATFDASYRAASNVGRQHLLGWLRPVAPYQPRRVIDLAEWTLANPAPDGATADIRVDRHESVVSILAGLLEDCAYGEHLERVCELLWRMGRRDDRETRRFPDHPVRVLTRIASYGPNTPVDVAARVAAVAMAWLDDPAVATYQHSPFDVLGALLAKEGLDPVSEGFQIRFGQYTVNPAATRALRSKVIEKALEVAVSGHPKVALAAVRVLEGALGDPVGFFGRVVGLDEKRVWEDEQLEVLGGLRNAARLVMEPIVLLKIHDAVHWSEARGQTASIRDGAREVREAVSIGFEYRLTRALTSPWSWDLEPAGAFDSDRAEAERVARLRAVAAEAVAAWPEAAYLAENIGRRMDAMALAGERMEPGYLMAMVCTGNEPLATGLAIYLTEHPDHPLGGFLAVVLRELRQLNESKALDLAEQAWDSGGDVARRAVAFLYGPATWVKTITPRDRELLRKVVGAQLAVPWGAGGGGVEALASSDVAEAKEMALAIEPTDRYQAEALADLLKPTGQLYPALSDHELDQVVAKFVAPDTVEEYHTQVFLAAAARRRPVVVARMLLARITAASDREVTRYHPVPFEIPGAEWWSRLDSSSRRPVLVEIRESMLLPHTAARAVLTPDLFSWVAGEWAEDAQIVVLEWAESGDEETVRASIALLSGAPRDVVFDQQDFVGRVLTAAEALTSEVGNAAARALQGAAYRTTKHRRVMIAQGQDQWVRERAAIAASAQPPGSHLYRFYYDLAGWAEAMQERMRKTDEEMLDQAGR